MEVILIVDAMSTGENFINDIIQRDFRPAVIWSWHSEQIFNALKDNRKGIEHAYEGKADFYTEDPDYAVTLRKVKEISPKFVLPGSDMGVELATRLADDLGLPGNPYERIDYYTNKDIMHRTLLEHGVRGVRGKVVHNWEETIGYYREEGFTGCVLKPYRGASSIDVRVCENEEQLKEAFDEVFSSGNYMGGREEGMLLEEQIVGTEYIVNTVSYAGKHKLSALWKHTKKPVKGGGMVYDFTESLNRLEAGCTSLVKYAFSVLDTLGVMYGCVHSEIMIDEKGPVLIEVNCRPMGSHMDANFLDRIWGHHETDLCLDAFLHPDAFLEHVCDPFRPLAKGLKKHLITPEEEDIVSASILSLYRRQKSLCRANLEKAISGHLKRTVDLSSAAGVLYLVNEDESQLMRDLQFWERAETRYFNMLFSNRGPAGGQLPEGLMSVEDVIDKIRPVGAVLLLSNEITHLTGSVTTDMASIHAVTQNFQYGILDLNYDETEDYEMMADAFFALADRIRRDGYLYVPKRTYWHFPCGVESVEMLCEVAGLEIEAPDIDSGELLAARKV